MEWFTLEVDVRYALKFFLSALGPYFLAHYFPGLGCILHPIEKEVQSAGVSR